MSVYSPLLLSALIPAALMLLTWRLSLRLRNFSFVDVAWALAFTPVAIVHATLGGGWAPRRLTIVTLVSAWSLRLGIHLWRRVARHHPAEDPRYRVLRERWKGNLAGNFLGFFLAQGLLVTLLALPVLLICRNPAAGFESLEVAGFALLFVALAGEGLADRQLRLFKAETGSGPGVICRKGLWNWSRHPNYFFQSLLWVGLFLAAVPAPWGWTSFPAPLVMLYLLLRVTGIPLTEALALEKHGDAYREYQRATSAFVPLPPRRADPPPAAGA